MCNEAPYIRIKHDKEQFCLQFSNVNSYLPNSNFDKSLSSTSITVGIIICSNDKRLYPIVGPLNRRKRYYWYTSKRSFYWGHSIELVYSLFDHKPKDKIRPNLYVKSKLDQKYFQSHYFSPDRNLHIYEPISSCVALICHKINSPN